MFVYTGADGNYALQTAVWILSLSRTQSAALEVCIIGDNWSRNQRLLVEQFQSNRLSIRFLDVDKSDVASIKVTNNFPLATTYNILAPQIFFADQRRVLYMDADTVVTQDLSDLWNQNLSHPVGAVVDAHVSWMASPSMWRPWREEKIPPLTPYLNTGVLLINVKEWNESFLSERSVEYLKKYELPCVDQDALNLVVRGSFDRLEPRFNSMPYHHLKLFRYADTIEDDSAIQSAIEEPSIIHFHRSFLGKPWNFGCSHPGVNIWRSLANEVSPGWHKRLALNEFGRSWIARIAGMTKLDARSANHPRTVDEVYADSVSE